MFPGGSLEWGRSRNCTDPRWVFLMEYFPFPAENPPQWGYNAHLGSRIHPGFCVWHCCLALLTKHLDPGLAHHREPSQVVASLFRSIPEPHKPYNFKHCTCYVPGEKNIPSTCRPHSHVYDGANEPKRRHCGPRGGKGVEKFGPTSAQKVGTGREIITPNLLLLPHKYYCYLFSYCFAASKYLMGLKLHFFIKLMYYVHGVCVTICRNKDFSS